MSRDDYAGEIVASGRWLYAASVWKPVQIVAFDCDYFFERMPTDDGRTNWDAPHALNEEGELYYVKCDGDVLPLRPFTSIVEAKVWVDAQPWGPAEWAQPD